MTHELEKQEGALFDRVARILESARMRVARTVNTAMVQAYSLVSRELVEIEQGGEVRAGYGDEVVKRLSRRLTEQYGRGFNTTNIKRMRQFYLAFPTGSRLPDLVRPAAIGAAARPHRNAEEKVPQRGAFLRRARWHSHHSSLGRTTAGS